MSSDNGFLQVDISAIPSVPETSLAKMFGVQVEQQTNDAICVRVTLTAPALNYLCQFSSDANAGFHAETGLVQGSLWMLLIQLVVSEWIPRHGPHTFKGEFPAASVIPSGEQRGFRITITKTGKRSLCCVVGGPFGGESPPEVFRFDCQIFPMVAALRGR